MSQLLGGRYQLIRVLGSNTLGQTYLATDTQLPSQPERVVRELQLPNDRSRSQQFVISLLKKKAESLSRLSSHDRIPKILSFFEENASFYLVEEFVEGRSLEEEILPGRPLPEEQVILLLREILEILVIVHGWGLVHRSVKPSSLIRRQLDGRLVLTGFGVFKEIGSQGVRSPEHAPISTNGTAYVSPEQLQRQVQFNTDLYAVGVIGIEALTGLSSSALSALLNDNRNGTSGWQGAVQASPELVGLLGKMVHPDSKQRYQLATEVLDDVNRLKPLQTTETPDTLIQPTLNRGGRSLSHGWVGKSGWMAVGVAAGLLLLAFSRVPQRLAASYFQRQGTQYLRQEQPDQAIASFTRALQVYPDATTYINRGMATLQQGNPQSALADLTQAIQRNPKLSQALYERANVRYELGDRQGAIADYTQVIQLDSAFTAAYVNRGNVRADLGDEQGAETDYTQAIQLNPNLAEAYLNRCLSRSNLQNHREAINDCTQAINLQPNSVLAYQNRGLVRRRLGDLVGAIEDFNIAIRLDSDDADPYYNRGLARVELGDNVGAIADYTEALEHDPTHVLAYYDRGLTRSEMGDIPGAIADFQQSATLCLDSGKMGCYEDAQYQLAQLQQQFVTPTDEAEP